MNSIVRNLWLRSAYTIGVWRMLLPAAPQIAFWAVLKSNRNGVPLASSHALHWKCMQFVQQFSAITPSVGFQSTMFAGNSLDLGAIRCSYLNLGHLRIWQVRPPWFRSFSILLNFWSQVYVSSICEPPSAWCSSIASVCLRNPCFWQGTLRPEGSTKTALTPPDRFKSPYNTGMWTWRSKLLDRVS